MKATTYLHDKKNNKIFIDPPMKKCKNGIKIYFSRSVDEREMTDYPICTADCPKGDSIDWIKGFEIVQVLVKRTLFFGLFSNWHIAENIESASNTEIMKYGNCITKGAKIIPFSRFFE